MSHIRRITLLVIILSALSLPDLTLIPVRSLPVIAASFEDINRPEVFVKQSQKNTCTLASAAMLVRRAALASGNSDWRSITETGMRSTAWLEGTGLYHSFTYAGIQVAYGDMPGKTANVEWLKSMLAVHPEGLIIYDRGVPHAILITDYTDGIFYAADPANNKPAGRIPVSSASITVYDADNYWYVLSPKVTLAAVVPGTGTSGEGVTSRVTDDGQKTSGSSGEEASQKEIRDFAGVSVDIPDSGVKPESGARSDTGSEPDGSTKQGTGTKPDIAAPAASVTLAKQEKTIKALTGDRNLPGSTYQPLATRIKNSTRTTNTLVWNKVKGASGYIIYGNKCGKTTHFKKIGYVKGTSYRHKKLKKAVYYKYIVVAYQTKKGTQTVLGTSRTVFAATTGGKLGNCKKLKLNKSKITLKRKKTFTVKAVELPVSNRLKIRRYRKSAFESSNPAIATVSAAGRIKGLKKGSCKVYVYAQNGLYRTILVHVK